MLRKLMLVFFALMFVVPCSHAMTIGDVELPDTLQITNADTLILNGGGIRKKFFMDIYVAGLYLKEKNSDYMDIINMDEDMAIKIVIVSKLITAERFMEATEAGFERTTNGNTEPIRGKIDKALQVFNSEFNVGDVFDIVYIKGQGTTFTKNGKFISTITGMDFKKALFGIWIIDKPSHKNEKLREGMLGLR
ncbi:MAG: chalcone isomerase family protein [Thermodesulfobacteriota bacterium]|nr:chalcone isomerase family protein [Thermodesulfobacteriota bacterium]